MEVRIQHLDKVSFAASARGHRVICDLPPENGGSDQGLTPPEFLLVSLGTCAGFYAAKYLESRSLPVDGLAVSVSAEKLMHPPRLGKFCISVEMPDLDPAHEAGLLRAVDNCLIHNTLRNTPSVEITVNDHARACVG